MPLSCASTKSNSRALILAHGENGMMIPQVVEKQPIRTDAS
jgi:hypothetical protein